MQEKKGQQECSAIHITKERSEQKGLLLFKKRNIRTIEQEIATLYAKQERG